MAGTDNVFNTKEPDSDKYILFWGTKFVQKRKMGNPLWIVIQTGFKAFKGNLLSSILYPKPDDDKFTRDSVKILFLWVFYVL